MLPELISKILLNTTVYNKELLDISEPSIIMPNHTSLADAVVLANLLPKDTYFVANFKNAKKFKPLLKGRNVITLDPSNAYSLRNVIKVIKSGKSVVIFPEGRITRNGTLMKIYDGVSFIAIKTNAKIIPVFINNLENTKYSYLKDYPKRKIFAKPKIMIGESFRLKKEENVSMKIQKKSASDKITKILQDGILKLKSKDKEELNLFNELIEASKIYGENYEISEDINGKARYKDILINCYVLSKKFDKLLKDQQNIGILMPNVNAHIVTIFSLFKIGKTPAILNFSAGEATMKDNLETGNIKTVITSNSFIESGKLHHLLDAIKEAGVDIIFIDKVNNETQLKVVKGETEKIVEIFPLDKVNGLKDYLLKTKSKHFDNEVILFTSGSEAKPKGVILTHENMLSNMNQCLGVIDVGNKDYILNTLPMFHSFGFVIGTLLPLIKGVQLYTYPNPLHYKVIPEIAYNKMATIIFGTSTFLSGYGRFANEMDFFKIRYAVCGGEKLQNNVKELWQEKFGIRILEGYGITETAPVLALNTPKFNKAGTVGKILPGIDYKLEKVEGIEKGGNLFVKGPNITKGYLINGKGFVPMDDWYETGDIVDIDENGFVEIKSRLKRFAKLGGEMISLNLIESSIKENYKEVEFACISIPDVKKGEQIILFSNKKDINKDEIRECIINNGFTNLYVPSKIEFIDSIPLLGSGKTNYVKLKEDYLNKP